jgi:prepilin-type N-terminal cleavage/methylation domain-containing protein
MRVVPDPSEARRQAGFTLIELIIVMLVVGVLAVVALPKMTDLGGWRVQAFADELTAQTMAMQRLALVQRRPVVATITGSGVSFDYASGGANIASVACPSAVPACIAEGGSRSATFNAANSGRVVTSSGSALPITVSGAGTTLSYVLEAETGLIHSAP